MVKLRDVALHAGVSVATVSRALNKDPAVKPETAAKVLLSIKALGYRPNAVARNLRRKATAAWQLVVNDLNNPFYTSVARGVEDVAAATGYSVLVGNSNELQEREARYLEVAMEEQVAGVIIAPMFPSTMVQEVMDAGIPLVAINQRLEAPVDSVVSDGHEGAIRATQHLVAQGWTRIACITGPTHAGTAIARASGYKQVVSSHGFEALVEHTSYDAAGGAAAAERLLRDSASRPDSLLIANSTLALGALRVAKDLGLRLGDDLGVIAFDDSPWATLVDPPLTVVAQRPYEMGQQAAHMLLSRIKGTHPTIPRTLVLDATLIKRASCRRRT